MNEKILSENGFTCYQYRQGEKEIYPAHQMINNWMFYDTVRDQREAELANAMAQVAEINGMSANELHHLFPAVLRMLKSGSNWAR